MTDLVDRGVSVAAIGQDGWHGAHVELLRVGDLREVVPTQRHRNGSARPRADAVGRRNGAVAAVLVEIDENVVAAVFLPPGARDVVGPLLQLTCKSDRR